MIVYINIIKIKLDRQVQPWIGSSTGPDNLAEPLLCITSENPIKPVWHGKKWENRTGEPVPITHD